jgi:regulator of protease activity HflC (stomatin/prohibitin superfamily)
MITVTVSFKPSGSSAEVIAQMVELLAELENSVTTESNSESGSNSVEVVVQSAKPRKVRVYTDEQKAAFRARMVAAREAKAQAQENAEIDAQAEADLEKKLALAGAKPISGSNARKPTIGQKALIAKKSKSIKLPMPRTGQKVKSSPAAP